MTPSPPPFDASRTEPLHQKQKTSTWKKLTVGAVAVAAGVAITASTTFAVLAKQDNDEREREEALRAAEEAIATEITEGKCPGDSKEKFSGTTESYSVKICAAGEQMIDYQGQWLENCYFVGGEYDHKYIAMNGYFPLNTDVSEGWENRTTWAEFEATDLNVSNLQYRATPSELNIYRYSDDATTESTWSLFDSQPWEAGNMDELEDTPADMENHLERGC